MLRTDGYAWGKIVEMANLRMVLGTAKKKESCVDSFKCGDRIDVVLPVTLTEMHNVEYVGRNMTGNVIFRTKDDGVLYIAQSANRHIPKKKVPMTRIEMIRWSNLPENAERVVTDTYGYSPCSYERGYRAAAFSFCDNYKTYWYSDIDETTGCPIEWIKLEKEVEGDR